MDIRKFIRSFRYAMEGIATAAKEQNMRFHFTAMFVVIGLGIWTGLSKVEWLVVIVIMALVIGAEMMNTAIERVVDLASPDIHPLAKQAKDVAAGAVLTIAIASVIIGCIIFIPKWF